MSSKILIHTALLPEARPIIDFLKLKQDNSVQNLPPYCKLFSNQDYILIVSGIGKEKTFSALDYVIKIVEIKHAINIGIAGCVDTSIEIGTLFCINKNIGSIPKTTITTVDTPCDNKEVLSSVLVDMESRYFEEFFQNKNTDYTILKVVSDYLEPIIPKKSFVINLIQKSLKQWKHIL